MKIDGTWKTYKKNFSKIWHFDPKKKKSNDLKFICNIKTDYNKILDLCERSINKKNSNYFLSKKSSNDKMYKNRNNEIQEIGYKKNTNEFYQVFSNDHYDIFEKFIKITNLEYATSSVIIQPPGNVLGWHQDTFVNFRLKNKHVKNKEVYRYMLMLEDWKWGHYFTAGNDTITQWKQGDLFFWEPHIFHCGANAGIDKKITLNITGFASNESLHLKNKKKSISI